MIPAMTTKTKAQPDESKLTRQDKRKTESYQRLLTAARKLFVERGYHETRPQDISRLAGAGHGTFYLYFPDKKACFQAFVAQVQEEADALIQARIASCRTNEERIYGVLDASVDYVENNPGVLKAAWAGHQLMAAEEPAGETTDSISDEWAVRWSKIIARGQKAGLIWEDYDPEIIGYTMLMVTSVISFGVLKGREDREHFLTNLTKFILRALTAPRPARAPSN
jgi:AcrR family transcriptional regulator